MYRTARSEIWQPSLIWTSLTTAAWILNYMSEIVSKTQGITISLWNLTSIRTFYIHQTGKCIPTKEREIKYEKQNKTNRKPLPTQLTLIYAVIFLCRKDIFVIVTQNFMPSDHWPHSDYQGSWWYLVLET